MIPLAYTTAGSVLWNLALVSLGAVLGESWGKIAYLVGEYSHIMLIVLSISGVSGIIWFYRTRSAAIPPRKAPERPPESQGWNKRLLRIWKVSNYQDLLDCGSYSAAKEKGLVGLEGKEYVVKLISPKRL